MYSRLPAEKRYALKAIALLTLLLVVGTIALKQLAPHSSTLSTVSEKYAVDAPTLAVDTGGTEAVFIDPIMPPIDNVPVPGTDAESYEVSDYYVSIETGSRHRECDTVLTLKTREDVIFEQVSESTYGCNLTFKVKRESAETVLAFINALDPRDVNESTYTIKREVSQYEDQITILEKKRAALDTALDDAISNFAEVEALARRSGDAASLAQAIESKVTAIERINASRLEVTAELDRLALAKADVLDRMNFVHFSVNVYENGWLNGDDLKDSWVAAVQQFIRDLNTFFQDLSIGFVQFALMVIKYTLYASVLYLIARPIVRRVRQNWNEL